MSHDPVGRREFLGKSALAGTSLAVGTLASASAAASPNETIRVGVVGPGGRGTNLMRECVDFGKQYNAQVTAVCDIWNQRRERAEANVTQWTGKRPQVYRNLADMLENVEAVIIGTPDHQHAKMLQMSVDAGKDVYCEKPFGNVLTEANAALDAVRKSGRVVQIGTQRRSDAKFVHAANLMKQRVVGDICKVEYVMNAYRPYRWATRDAVTLKEKDVDWPAFLMGKPARPFDPRIYRSFRLFRDFSSGIIDQWMTHSIDAIHLLTGENYPRTVTAQGGIYRYRDYRENADTIDVVLEYGRGEKTFPVHYGVALTNGHGTTMYVLGTRGTLEFESNWRVSGDGCDAKDHLEEEYAIDDAPDILHHMANWLDCVRRQDVQGVRCSADAGHAHSVACIAATDAYWSGRRMAYDPQQRVIAPA